ncbi:hypothetical protein ACFQX7_11550 [Luedemannella flava]
MTQHAVESGWCAIRMACAIRHTSGWAPSGGSAGGLSRSNGAMNMLSSSTVGGHGGWACWIIQPPHPSP